MFTENANQIFRKSIADYHRYDDVDRAIENPYAEGSIEHLLYMKNWIDTVQWHLEDIIRDPNIDPEEALKIMAGQEMSFSTKRTRKAFCACSRAAAM